MCIYAIYILYLCTEYKLLKLERNLKRKYVDSLFQICGF